MPAPETVTEAVLFLEAEGYATDFAVDEKGLWCGSCEARQSAETAIVDYTFRFEGPSDPADEAIVLGLRCAECGAKGVIVSGFGPTTDRAHVLLFSELARKARQT